MKSLTFQYLRAIAAVSVVLYHSSYYQNLLRGESQALSVFGGAFGSFGVLVFFALSGCLMAIQARKMSDQPARFLAHRLIRIFPIYWLTSAAYVAASFLLGYGVQFDPVTLLLAPVGERDYLLAVEWTLVFEVFFYVYVLVFILLRQGKHIEKIAMAWLGLVALAAIFLPSATQRFPAPAMLFLSSHCAAFACGLLVPAALKRGAMSQALLPVGIALFAASQLPFLSSGSLLIGGAGCALIVAWGLGTSTDLRIESKWLAKLGDWSFCFYLVHVPVVLIVYQALPASVAAGTSWAVATSAALLLGAAFGVMDVRLYERMKAAVDRRNSGQLWALSGAFGVCFLAALLVAAQQPAGRPQTFSIANEVSAARDEAAAHAALAISGVTPASTLTGGLNFLTRQPDGVLLFGWVNDTASRTRSARLAFWIDGGAAYIVTPTSYRTDLMLANGFPGYHKPAGFRDLLSSEVCPPGSGAWVAALNASFENYGALARVQCPPALPQ